MVSGRSRPGHCCGSTLHSQREVALLTGVIDVVDSGLLRGLALWLRCRGGTVERLRKLLLLVVLLVCGNAFAAITPTGLWSFNYGGYSGSFTTPQLMCVQVGHAYAAIRSKPDSKYSGVVADVHASQADCSAYGVDEGFQLYMASGYQSLSCPANSYGTDSCVCNAGFTDNGKNACTVTPVCSPSGTKVSSGYFDTGTSISAGPKVLVCSGGCQSIFDGTFPAGSRTVGGVKHYYAQGSYVAAEGTCTPSTTAGDGGMAPAPGATPSVPADVCAPGEVAGTVNGRKSCVNSSTGVGGTVSSVPGSSSSSSTAVTPNADGSSDAATTVTTSAPDGSTSTTVTTTHTNANGTAGGTTATTSGTGATNGTGAGAANSAGGTGSNTTPDDGSNPCKANPAGSGCGGTPGEVPALWTAKDKTVGTVLTNAKNTLMASGIGSGVANFFTVQQGGTCPPSTWAIAYFHTTISVGTFCTDFAAQMFLVIRGVLLLVATFMAFRAAIE